MKILLVHNSYQQPGGEDQVFTQEAELLTSHGHEVIFYKVSNDLVRQTPALAMLGKTIWNSEMYQQLRMLMRDQRPHIVHVHNTFPMISPAAYHAAKDEGIPIVKTLHNYRMLCPSATLFRNGRVCEDCVGKQVPYPGVMHGCYRGSRLATSATAAMMTIHHFKKTWTETIDAYIALSPFAREKFIEGGFPANKIFVKPNYLQNDPGVGSGQGKYALFVGRLSPEKGLGTLLAAWRQLGADLPLQIAGDGPLAYMVEQACRENENISWLKWLPHHEILLHMKEASALILTSEWFEGFPIIIPEGFAVGLPIIASNLGIMASIIEDGRTGLHFEAGNPAALVDAVRWFQCHPDETALMRTRARAEYEKKYTAEVNYVQLLRIYEAVLSAHSGSRTVSVIDPEAQGVTA